MQETKTYDKLSWHYPDKEGCDSMEKAMVHLSAIHEWLKSKNLLTSEAAESNPQSVGEDYSLTSEDVTEKGKEILDECYEEWLNGIEYSMEPPAMGIFDECFAKKSE